MSKKHRKPNKQKKKRNGFGIRDSPPVSGRTDDSFKTLCRRVEDDPMHLCGEVVDIIKNYFLKSNSTLLLPAQRDALTEIAKSILSAAPDTATAVPLVPGGGKSTLIRALLEILSKTFFDMTAPIAQRIGGIIVVVEKSSEAHSLEDLCNRAAGQRVAVVIESPNDYNLRTGCPNSTATRFEECLRRQCPDYGICPLVRAASRTEETPILILLHARYQRYMEDMSPFLTWYAGEKAYHRTMLLVDELPAMFEESPLCLAALNEAETELDQLKASYHSTQRAAKQDILYQWNRNVRTPFFKLSRLLQSKYTRQGLVTKEMMSEAGFQEADLEQLQEKLNQYAQHTKAEAIVSTLLSEWNIYHSTDRTFTLFVPRLKRIDTNSQLATFIFSGTATLSPELSDNPDVTMLADASFHESYSRLRIFVQQGEGFSASKTALENSRNMEGVVEWLRSLLPKLIERHRKILFVTYQQYAGQLWLRLPEYQDSLIPYIGGDGRPAAKMPYFGGLNGSNQYQEATCVVCVGLNRFEPREYLSRALALDFTGEIARAMCSAAEEGKPVRCDQIPSVQAMENITLARDLVQLVFRSALRKHGEQDPIEFWLLHPPDAVLEHLRSYFADCQIGVIPELLESCRHLATASRRYKSEETHAAKLLRWLENNQSQEFTPEDIRSQTGLTLGQFKEAKKHPEVRKYFADRIETKGSGRHTSYRRKQSRPPPDMA